MKATVSVKLEDFDEIRSKAEKYEKLSNGLNGFLIYLRDASVKGHEQRPFKKMSFWRKRYNETNPTHPFHIL